MTERAPTPANVRKVLERAGYSFGGGRDAGRMGRSAAHAYTSGLKVKAIFDLFGTGVANPRLGSEVHSYGSCGPDLKEVAAALREAFPSATVVEGAMWVEVRA